ncbi:phage holin, lambda family [Serratia sp. JSRIV001]|uniref:phage holin, lambda family n=1 Tax=Serratia TaxID=613 RepID=UPI001CBB24B2|nr:phage holin, lambda family [Serratia sp. JSRIV001]UAN43854.1 phage holin, lambda family [Serratia sp. JSRIV001]HBE9077933.1 phage holin, lambda family [Serratia fonticola]HBE9093199.1 phage holin, lambda family [Serratia fonticola]
MPEKSPDFWAPIFAWLISVKEQGVAALLAGVMAWLRGKYEGDGGWKSFFDALMCSVFGWFVKDGLAIVGVGDEWAYFASVIIGYLGTRYFGDRLKDLADRKTGASK